MESHQILANTKSRTEEINLQIKDHEQSDGRELTPPADIPPHHRGRAQTSPTGL